MIAMPEPDRGVLARRGEIVEALRRIVPGEGVIDHEKELRAFESDGLTAIGSRPWWRCCLRRQRRSRS